MPNTVSIRAGPGVGVHVPIAIVAWPTDFDVLANEEIRPEKVTHLTSYNWLADKKIAVPGPSLLILVLSC
jgi:hypothetical protein